MVKLYRIRDKRLDKFFTCWYTANRAQFTPQGTFFRMELTVKRHLKTLLHDRILKDDPKWKKIFVLGKFRPENMEHYEVVITDLDLNTSETKQASEIMNG